MKSLIFLQFVLLTISPRSTRGQFPSVCNNPYYIESKTCCPNNCGGPARGACRNIAGEVAAQWESADPAVTSIMLDAPNNPAKGTADARYQWPTVVFENVCECKGNYGGVDCNQCDYGWSGEYCDTKTLVTRKAFSRLTDEEKEAFVQATLDLKNEMGYWSVIVHEPSSYTTGSVTLQDVSTFNYFIFLHEYTARAHQQVCLEANNGVKIDFAHQGPVFPVWHRNYLLVIEREFQRIMDNDSFGLPYWQWEENDMSMFTPQYFGVPSHNDHEVVNVMGSVINPTNWNTICDLEYRRPNIPFCWPYWKPCNPEIDLAKQNPLQRGGISYYLPNTVEVQIAITAPSYDSADDEREFGIYSPRGSFRNRFEGYSSICSAAQCAGPRNTDTRFTSHMHNAVHVWIGGHMLIVPSAINDPIFNLHHTNVDRILESWFNRYANGSSNSQLLTAYAPVSGGHPGHNRDDYMVPFFPVRKPGDMYRIAAEFGYEYDELIPADLQDSDIPDCEGDTCPMCDADGTCYDCLENVCQQPENEITEEL